MPDEGIDLRGRASVRIGRAVDNDLALDDLRISRHHAEIAVLPDGGFEVRDLASSNGTFLNGQRIRTERLEPGDFVGLGGQTLQLLDGRLRVVSARNTAWFGAVDLVVSIGDRRILDEVGFALEPSSMLAVVGPSGSGKSTLLNALTGFRPAESGHVVFDGRDVYATFQDVRTRMGLVPQADILHTQLTVRQALGYAAELRFPRDVPSATQRARVDQVMSELNLEERADVRLDRLSGGQRKRVSVGCELLTEPALLFLDEPTSGLDPGNEESLMEALRDLARAGRTVVVVTHSVQSLHLADRLLVMAPGGRLAFYGPPSEALPYFAGLGADASAGYAGMFQALEERRDVDWKASYRSSAGYARLVTEPLASADLVAIPVRPNIDPPPPPTPVFHQLGVLIRRYVAVIKADRGFALTLALQAPIFGVLFSLMFFFNTMLTAEALNASLLVWLLVVGATWLGTSNAIREIVKELPIYHRERAIGLSAGAYVMSKVAVLGVITAIQAVVLVPLTLLYQTLPPANSPSLAALLIASGVDPAVAQINFPSTGAVFASQTGELIVVAIVVGLASMALGLLISAIAGGVDRASTLLPVILVTQVIVSVPLFTGSGVVLQTLGYGLSARWGMAAAASTIDLAELRKPYIIMTETARSGRVIDDLGPYDQPTWRHDAAVWTTDVAILFALTAVGLVGAWLALRSTDPDLMEGRHKRRRRTPTLLVAPPHASGKVAA
ncbi:MAG TPA: ATP-binding cassette domain-containing protein [Candidatus Limnocylindria bacterium]|nr:ATP-binding cassette domain-containing protein [Candidatus Limnocylindria bacterium]